MLQHLPLVALLALALCVPGSARADLYDRVILGFTARDLVRAVTFDDGLVAHDLRAVLGPDAVEEAAERAMDFVRPRARRQAHRLDELDATGRRLLRAHWQDRGKAAIEEIVVGDLRQVAEGKVPPHRPYLSPRYDAVSIRDAALGVKRRGNVGSLLHGFERYSEADRRRLERAEELLGEARSKRILAKLAAHAGVLHARYLARILARHIRGGERPTREELARAGDLAFDSVVATLRKLIARAARLRKKAIHVRARDLARNETAATMGEPTGAAALNEGGASSGLFGTD